MSTVRTKSEVLKTATDGSTMIDINTADKEITLNALVKNTNGTGTFAGSVSVEEFGDGRRHYTKLSFTDLDVGADVAGGADEAEGVLLYTLPAGVQKINAVYSEIALSGPAAIQADTPEIGIGTVIATGAVAVLGGTATFEDILEGSAAADVNGTVNIDSDLAVNQLIAAASAKTVHLNIADGWAAGGGQVAATGFIILEWTQLKD